MKCLGLNLVTNKFQSALGSIDIYNFPFLVLAVDDGYICNQINRRLLIHKLGMDLKLRRKQDKQNVYRCVIMWRKG